MESLFTLVFLAALGSEDTIWITVLVFIIMGACAALWNFLKKKDAGYNRQNEEDSYYPAQYTPTKRKWTWQFQNTLESDKAKTPETNSPPVAQTKLEPQLSKEQPTPAVRETQPKPEVPKTIPKPVIAEVISPIDSGVVKVHAIDSSEQPDLSAQKKIEKPATAPAAAPKAKTKRKSNLAGGLELLESNFLIELLCDTAKNTPDDIKMKHIVFEELIHRKLLNQLPGTVLKEYSINKNKLFSKSIQCAALTQLASRTRQKQTVNS